MRTQIINRSTKFSKVLSGKSLLAAGLAAIALCHPVGQTAWAAPNERAPVLVSAVPAIPGPKRTIAVGQIDVLGSYASGNVTEVGGAISAMLSTALEESGNFVVVERNALPAVMNEQTLATSGVTSGSAAPTPGQVLPASYIVVGSITNITTPGNGNGGGFSIGGSNIFSLGAGGGDIQMDLRILDTRTSAVVKAFSVKRKLTSLNLGFNGFIRGVPVATNQFFNSSLGNATRKALNDAVGIISNSLGRMPWQGQVVEAEGDQVYVNAGTEAGITPGTHLAIRRLGRTFTDPATGAVLSRQMIQIGEVTITGVEGKMAYGTFTGTTGAVRGDIIEPI